MRIRAVIISATTFIALLAAHAQAQAGLLDFQYGTTVTPSPINPTVSVPAQGSVLNQAGVGSYPSPTGPIYNAAVNGALGTDVTVGTFTITDLGLGAYTDGYGPSPINVNFALKDVDSGMTGLFSFTGLLSGQVSSNGTTGGSTFNNPFLAAAQIQNIGGTEYVVRIVPTKDFAAPGSPPSGGTGLPGAYSFNVLARANFGVPEPTSIGLFAFGGLLVPLALRHRRAKRIAANKG